MFTQHKSASNLVQQIPVKFLMVYRRSCVDKARNVPQ